METSEDEKLGKWNSPAESHGAVRPGRCRFHQDSAVLPKIPTSTIIPVPALPPRPEEAGRRPHGRPFTTTVRSAQEATKIKRSRRGQPSRQGWPEPQATPALSLP